MNHLNPILQSSVRRLFVVAMVCIVTFTAGCASMMKAKAKTKAAAQDKFSCGEPLPGRIP